MKQESIRRAPMIWDETRRTPDPNPEDLRGSPELQRNVSRRQRSVPIDKPPRRRPQAVRPRRFSWAWAGWVISLSACATGPPLPAPPTGTPRAVSAPTTTAVTGRTPARIDPSHPLRIGEEYYPPESRRLHEEGICVVRLQVDADGHIRATQLLSSSGFERLNQACLTGFTDGRLLAATLDGKPVATWVAIPVVWRLTNNNLDITPQIRADYHLKIGPDDYPPISLKLHQEGDCVVHVTVGVDGTLSSVAVIKSTGYEPLDQACAAAIAQAPFIPARLSGTPFAASTEINISWRFPWPKRAR